MYPTFVEADIFLAGIPDAIFAQIVHTARTSPDRAWELARLGASEVAVIFCIHGEEALRPLEGTTTASRAASIIARGVYKGLCGRY